jgi:hypothetical protein
MWKGGIDMAFRLDLTDGVGWQGCLVVTVLLSILSLMI